MAVVLVVVARVAVGVVTKVAVVVCPGWVLVGSIMVRMNQAAK